MTLLKHWAPALVATAAGAATAMGGASFEIIGLGYAHDVSADGSVVVGNDLNYGTFRWTADGGMADLGRNAWLALGSGAGTPDVSEDGRIVSATILDETGQYQTPGRWTEGVGWQDLVLPPPSGYAVGDSLGSAWGMSGDGQTVTGFRWADSDGPFSGGAVPTTWTQDNTVSNGGGSGAIAVNGGPNDMPFNGGNGRINAANLDGSVVVGWDEKPFGNWQPVVWENGVRTQLSDNDGFTSATSVNADGTVVGGTTYIAESDSIVAAIWRKESGSWTETPIGVLPGTFPGFGLAEVTGLSADGSIAVGFNRPDFAPQYQGFIWTEETGMMNAEDYVESLGIVLPAGFLIGQLSAISSDGTTIVGFGLDLNAGSTPKSFVIRVPAPGAAPLAAFALAGVALRRRVR